MNDFARNIAMATLAGEFLICSEDCNDPNHRCNGRLQ
jgi:hypothetical protein